MVKKTLSNKTKKCLSNQIGEEAAKEIYDVINRLVHEIERLEKNKVEVTKIVKDSNPHFFP
jgi:ERCC4-type nuclease